MSFDLITCITASRSLRRACEARVADHDDAGAEHDARIALLDLARGLEVEVYPSRPTRWTGTDSMARNVEAAVSALAEAAQADFHQAGLSPASRFISAPLPLVWAATWKPSMTTRP